MRAVMTGYEGVAMPHETYRTASGRKNANTESFDMLQRSGIVKCLGCIALIALPGFPLLGAVIATYLQGTSANWVLVGAIGGAYGLIGSVAIPMLLMGPAWLLLRHSSH